MRWVWLIILLCTSILSYAANGLKLSATRFDLLPGWQHDEHSKAFTTFVISCREIITRGQTNPPDVKLIPSQIGFTANWLPSCQAAIKAKVLDDAAAKHFFETWFTPYAVNDQNNQTEGLFTGYYLPLLQVNHHRTAAYSIPIYGLPRDLVKADLGLFPVNLTGKSIAGRVQDGQLIPYADRASIVAGEIHDKAPVIAWTNSAIDLFFAQIQGSAIIQYPDKHIAMIGYDGSNGHAYSSIANTLIQQNQIALKNVSMTSLRNWLLQHPKQMQSVLNTDASYVFFKIKPAALGTEHVALTPQRSLAVDANYHILGMPIWLSTTLPTTDKQTIPFQHLMIAQDTGGAITGVIRGDIFFGAGDEAAWFAGNMKNAGKIWVLLPKKQAHTKILSSLF